jgi:hypothetical protein
MSMSRRRSGEVPRERALAGSDLDDGVVGRGVERGDDAALLVGIDEKVLAERLLGAVAVISPHEQCGTVVAGGVTRALRSVREHEVEDISSGWSRLCRDDISDEAGLARAAPPSGYTSVRPSVNRQIRFRRAPLNGVLAVVVDRRMPSGGAVAPRRVRLPSTPMRNACGCPALA